MAANGGLGYNQHGGQHQGGQNKGGQSQGTQHSGRKIRRGPARSLTEPLNWRQAQRFSRKSARAEARPVISAIKHEREGWRQKQKQDRQAFEALQNKINTLGAQTDQSYQLANNALIAHANAAAEAAQAQQAQIGAGQANIAKITGASPGAFEGVNQQAAAGANARQIAFGAMSNNVATQGANQAAYLRNTSINAARESINQRQKDQKARLKTQQDLAEARKARAENAVKGFQNLRQTEIENQIKRGAFHLEGKKFQNEKRENAKDRAERAEERAEGREQREWEHKHPGSTKSGGLTPSEWRSIKEKEHDRKQAWKAGMAKAWNLIQAHGTPPNGEGWNKLEVEIEKQGLNAAQATKVIQRVKARLRNKEKRNQESINNGPKGGATPGK